LVVEGAGGVLVPLNDTQTVIDLIQPDYSHRRIAALLGQHQPHATTLRLCAIRNLTIAGIVFNGYHRAVRGNHPQKPKFR
jgi:dethiobiotin synthetase